MNKFNLFLEKHGTKLILVLMLLTLMKSCSIDSELTVVKKELRKEQQVINNLPTKIDVQIEGLKSEKRMIQGTDRKMLDVQRQNQIEKEIKALSAIK
jgi:thiamine biosynthesis lipoprotein ApbE